MNISKRAVQQTVRIIPPRRKGMKTLEGIMVDDEDVREGVTWTLWSDCVTRISRRSRIEKGSRMQRSEEGWSQI